MTIEPLSAGLSTAGARLRAHSALLFEDHGFLRLIFKNRHAISPEMLRMNQPSPGDIAWAARKGIRTVINLRGPSTAAHYRLERAACASHGIEMVDLRLLSREPPDLATLRAARDLFERIEYPALMHCKSGADRAGMGALLYCLFRLNQPFSEARRQLSARYLHMKLGKTGVLDAFCDAYEAAFARSGLSFLEWAASEYDPVTLKRDYRAGMLGNFIVDRVLRRE